MAQLQALSRGLILVLLVLLVSSAHAYPWKWDDGAQGRCGTHPDKAYKVHLEPKQDSGISFKVNGGSVKELCPGNSYTITASWADASHRALLTTSQGIWADAQSYCATSTYLQDPASSATKKLTLGCTAKGSVVIKVTHSAPGFNYLYSQVTYKINTACAAKSCGVTAPKPTTYPDALKAVQSIRNTTIFVQLAQFAKLKEIVSVPTPAATIFVPSDKAFTTLLAKLKITAADVLKQPELVTSLLKYHVISGKAVTSAQLKNGQMLPTALTGKTLKVKISGSGKKKTYTIVAGQSQAKVVVANVKGGKAYIHVIDTVLIPAGIKL